MAQAVAPLKLLQFGREDTTAKGTLVAATSKMAVESFDPDPLDVVVRPQLVSGAMWEFPGNEVVVMRGGRWTAKGPVIYDQLQNWLEMGVVGCVSPSGSGTYTWVYTHDPTVQNAIASFTMQRRITDGQGNNLDQRWGYSFAQQLKFSAAMNDILRMEVQGVSRSIQTGAATSSLALPTVQIPPTPLMTVFIDTSWAGLGGTQVLAQVLSFDLTFRNGIITIPALDGRTDQDFSTHIQNGRNAGIEFNARLLIKADSGQYATEKTAARAQSLRAVSLEVAGSSSRALKLQFLGKHAMGDLYKVGEQDGYDIVDVKLVSATDLTNAFKATVVNGVSAIV